MNSSYDYIVVGSGAAGGILSYRLSEKGYRVCLLEAGSSNWHPFLHIPAGFIKVIFKKDFAWQFYTAENDCTGRRKIPIPQGKVLGGSTSINGLVYNRGLGSDYDNWADLGNDGWDFESVLPYFKKTERRVGGLPSTYRGYEGLLPVTDPSWRDEVCEAFIKGAEESGIERCLDYNGERQEGVGYFQRTIFSGRRVSTANAFVNPGKKKGLDVVVGAQATKVLFDGKRAVGVEYYSVKSKNIEVVKAKKEVVVCAGAVNTPKLLNLSGIGCADDLRELGIKVLVDLPGVGKNLKDHYSIRMSSRVKNATTINEKAKGVRLGWEVAKWLFKRPSILSLSPSVVHVFCKSDPMLSEPDVQGVFSPASYKEGYVGVLDKYPGMTCGFWQHRPKSTGEVRLISKDPFDNPLVQPNYLKEKEDQEKIVRCAKLARKLMSTESLSYYKSRETFPGEEWDSDEKLLEFCKRYGVSSYHLNGTARMGPSSDPMSVVDSELRVRGTEGLRVADSSIMPEIPSANICAATMMIGEKAADLIIKKGINNDQ